VKTPTTISEAMDALEQVAKAYFEGLYPKDRIPKIQRGGDLGENEKEDSDLHLEVEGWIWITPFHTKEEYPCIAGKRTRDAIHYSIQQEEILPGRRYYPDMSGEPDSVELAEVKLDKPLTSATQAIAYACKMMFDNELSHVAENFSESQMIDEEEQWERDSRP
jgi:hypothetical protein